MSHWEAEIYIKLPASVLLILCMIQSFKMVSTIWTKTAVHRRDEPEILSTKKRQYPSLSVINGARMRTSDHESPTPPFHKLMQVPQCSWSYNQFQDIGDIWHEAATSICPPQLVVYSLRWKSLAVCGTELGQSETITGDHNRILSGEWMEFSLQITVDSHPLMKSGLVEE